MRRTGRVSSTGETASPFAIWTTETTTAASPGHFSRRVAREIEERDPVRRKQTQDELRAIAADPVQARAYLRKSSMIDALERVKDSFNSYPLDRLAQAGAIAAYEADPVA